MILRRVFAKILHGVDDLGAVLHFVKDDQGLFGQDLLPAGEHQILQDSVCVLGSFKKLLVFLVFIKVEIGGVFVVTAPEFLQHPRFAHLPHALEDQRFAVGGVFSFEKIL